jgi:Uncharacterized protein conserved in bacteria (DUF2252)
MERPDPVEILMRQAQTRTPALASIRYGRMVRSPFAFFRGAAAIMAADLADTPVSGTRVQLCGDAHLANFGGFAAPDRRLVFDLNDFDETLPGPWEWDVRRLAASIEVAGRDRGFRGRERRDAVRGAARSYRKAMRRFAAMRTIDVWYTRLEEEQFSQYVRTSRRKDLDKALAKARRKDSLRALAKLTHDAGGEPRIVSDPPLVVPIGEIPGVPDPALVRDRLGTYLRDYQKTLQHNRRQLLGAYHLVDVAHKVVGVGSVGTRTWIALLLGHDASDPLFLQVKEAEPSVLEPYAGRRRATNQAKRVVEGQQLMQAASDVFLGWLRVADDLDGRRRDYYVRQLWDAKASAPIDAMPADDMADYGTACGWTLARAHARSGERVAIDASVGRGDGFDRALAGFAGTYADQNERDYAALVAAVKAGVVPAETGR